jgi:uracil-DNA glycosylase
MIDNFDALLAKVRDGAICAADLPLGPRPILRGTPDAKLLLIGQAPGTRVHESGVPWNDPSGERLRDWLQMTPDDF